jgi:hypothetical protein
MIQHRTGQVGWQWKQRYSSSLSLTSTMDEGRWSVPCPSCCTHGECPSTHCMGGEWAPGPVWTSAENLIPTRIRPLDCPDHRPLDCPDHSGSLYQLHYPGPPLKGPNCLRDEMVQLNIPLFTFHETYNTIKIHMNIVMRHGRASFSSTIYKFVWVHQ